MNNPTTYSVVIGVQLKRYPRVSGRYGYHYKSIEDVVKHMDWARDQFLAQAKEDADPYPDFQLSYSDVCVKRFNETQLQNDPPLECFSLLEGEKMPIGGKTFQSI